MNGSKSHQLEDSEEAVVDMKRVGYIASRAFAPFSEDAELYYRSGKAL